MNRNFKVAVSLLVIIAVIIWWCCRPSPKNGSTERPSVPSTAQQVAVPKSNPGASVSQNQPAPTNQTPERQMTKEERAEKRQSAVEHSYDEWRTPIEFYGMVMDDSNNVIVGAQVDFLCNDLSPSGTSSYHTQSDINGGFSIKGITGKLLDVKVNKDGYYSYSPQGEDFYYAGQNQNFTPNVGSPVIFRMHKKGEGADLIRYDKSFKLSRNGTPILVDLATGNLTMSGENTLKVEGWTLDNEKKPKYDWSCRVSVPGGGLQTNDDQFPFLAPEIDYVTEDSIDMPVTNNPTWSYIVHRNYYVHTAGGNFGRMVFTMVAGGDNFCEVNLFFNPAGSRSLEPK